MRHACLTKPGQETETTDRVTRAAEQEFRMWHAWRAKDWATVSALTAPDYYATNGSAIVWRFNDLKREFPRFEMRNYSLGTISALPINETATLLSFRATVAEWYAGKDISGTYVYTTVWAKRGNSWLIVFQQKIPAPRQ
jgi:hypothetical protein